MVTKLSKDMIYFVAGWEAAEAGEPMTKISEVPEDFQDAWAEGYIERMSQKDELRE